MPFVNIKVTGPSLNAEQMFELQHEATALLAKVMSKKPELTSVLIEEVPLLGWAIGGNPVHVAAHMDVKITAGTNTPQEKARFIQSAMALLKHVLGADQLHVATYVVIDEIAADAWGYDGQTQEARRGSAVVV